MPGKKTLVLGASDNPSRYSYLALKALQSKGHEVTAIGRRKAKVGEVEIETVILIPLRYISIHPIKSNTTITYSHYIQNGSFLTREQKT